MYHLIYNPKDRDFMLINDSECRSSRCWSPCFWELEDTSSRSWSSSISSALAHLRQARPDWPLQVVASSSTLPFHAVDFPELLI